jgi:hypothetical protein
MNKPVYEIPVGDGADSGWEGFGVPAPQPQTPPGAQSPSFDFNWSQQDTEVGADTSASAQGGPVARSTGS